MTQSATQKNLGMILNTELDFQEHINIFSTVNKTIGVLQKLPLILPKSYFFAIYKQSFIRSHLTYEDIIFDQIYNTSFHQKLELIQYNSEQNSVASLKFLEANAQNTCSVLFLFLFFITYNTRNTNGIPLFKVKHNFFESSFFHLWLLN